MFKDTMVDNLLTGEPPCSRHPSHPSPKLAAVSHVEPGQSGCMATAQLTHMLVCLCDEMLLLPLLEPCFCHFTLAACRDACIHEQESSEGRRDSGSGRPACKPRQSQVAARGLRRAWVSGEHQAPAWGEIQDVDLEARQAMCLCMHKSCGNAQSRCGTELTRLTRLSA